jgi:hypothetical protein
MSKISYSKNCIQHAAVAKAKRMLIKIQKQYGGFQGIFYGNMTLTGVDEIDNKAVKHYIERHLTSLKSNIEKQLKQNEYFIDGKENEDYVEGFYIPPFTEELKLVEALYEVGSYIRHNYPELEIKKSEFVFTKNTPEEKFNEAKLHFQYNPVVGFSQEYFAILESGEKKRLYPLTFSAYDLENAKSITVEYL